MSVHVVAVSARNERSGAPVQLATVIAPFAGALGGRVTVVVGADGPCTPAFEAAADRVVVRPRRWARATQVAARGPRVVSAAAATLARRQLRRAVGAADAVYVNSLASAALASSFDELPAIVHVHELANLAALSGAAGRALADRAAAVIVVSAAARRYVEQTLGVPSALVHHVPGAVPPSAFDAPAPAEVAHLRATLHLPERALVAVAIGWFGEVKGSDRFLDVAARTVARLDGVRPMRFVWVGGSLGTDAGRAFAAGVERRGLRDVVVHCPEIGDLRPLYRTADAVLVTSRLESLSLVALEAAAQERPVLCFPGSGGPEELAAEGITYCVPSADPDAMAEVLAGSPPDGARTRAAAEAVRTGHGSDEAGRAIAAVVRSVMTTVGHR